MSRNHSLPRLIVAWTLLSTGVVACGTGPMQSPATQAQAKPAGRWSHQDWPTGHYKVVEGWPKPLPDTRHSHEGWTWGSVGGVYAENPDRIWVAMRGELPLPKGAAPWTPYAALNPSRGNATGNSDGLSATCEPVKTRGWERRFQHSIIVFDRQGNLVDEWPHLDELFSKLPCGRGPHQIKINPYDKAKHVWIIDDQLHMIYRFTYDGKLVDSKGQLGCAVVGPHLRPADGYRLAARRDLLHHRRLRRHTRRQVRRQRQLHHGLGRAAQGSEEPGTERVEYGPQHRDQRRPPALHHRSRTCADAGLRREREVPRYVAAEVTALACQSEHAHGESLHR